LADGGKRFALRGSAATDEALLGACAEGQAEALGVLFDRHQRAVFRFVARLSGTDQRDLDDLTQMTFIRVGQSAGSFSGRSSVRSWIFAIAGHIVRDHIRAEVRRRNLVRAAVSTPPADTEPPDSTLEGHQALALFSSALSALSHDLRVTFVMCEIEDMPGKDAALALGIPEGTLWRRLHEARRILMAAIREPLLGGKREAHENA
jgi:RNA polymerase sigma-70 factor (ECF subfamily)